MVVHAFNPSTREAEAGRFLSSRPARAIKRKTKKQNPINPKTQNQNQTKPKKKIICVCVCRPEDNF